MSLGECAQFRSTAKIAIAQCIVALHNLRAVIETRGMACRSQPVIGRLGPRGTSMHCPRRPMDAARFHRAATLGVGGVGSLEPCLRVGSLDPVQAALLEHQMHMRILATALVNRPGVGQTFSAQEALGVDLDHLPLLIEGQLWRQVEFQLNAAPGVGPLELVNSVPELVGIIRPVRQIAAAASGEVIAVTVDALGIFSLAGDVFQASMGGRGRPLQRHPHALTCHRRAPALALLLPPAGRHVSRRETP